MSLLKLFPAALLLLGLVPCGAVPPPPAVSLDQLLRFPGSYSQVCDARVSAFPAPLPGFRTILHGEAGFSDKSLAVIKQQRASLIPAIASRLESLNPSVKPQPQPRDPAIPTEEVEVEPVGTDPAVFSTLLLTMIGDLDAVEVFPQLLAFEEKYYAALLAAEKDPAAPLPQFDGADGAGVAPEGLLKENEEYDTLTPDRKAAVERTTQLFRAQALHRDILTTLVRAMRKQGFTPMLESGLEKKYGRLLREKWATHEEFSKYRTATDIPEDYRESVKFDPLHKVAYSIWDPVDIPWTETTRVEVLELTRAFLKSRKS